jgi:hypothetical protein
MTHVKNRKPPGPTKERAKHATVNSKYNTISPPSPNTYWGTKWGYLFFVMIFLCFSGFFRKIIVILNYPYAASRVSLNVKLVGYLVDFFQILSCILRRHHAALELLHAIYLVVYHLIFC